MTEQVTPRRTRPHYEGDPTLAAVLRTPKWIAGLLLAIAVAGGFAWLGQWQLSHAITVEHEQEAANERVLPLGEVTAPGVPMTDTSASLVFSVSGSFVAGDFFVVEQRHNGGEEGAWLVGHLETNDEPRGHLAVAVGWAPDKQAAGQSLAKFETDFAGKTVDIEGRYMPAETPVIPDTQQDVTRLFSMSPAQLVNLWYPFEGHAYVGYLVLHPAGTLSGSQLDGYELDAIDSVPPLPVETINWLNLFYAVEWVVFGGFALFFWYRLGRDDWERIHELKLVTESRGALGGVGGRSDASP